jgi:hypothetical protein
VTAPPSADLNNLIQQVIALTQSMRGQSTAAPGTAPATDQQIEQLRKLVDIGRGMVTPETAKALTQRLGQVNGALGQTIGNLLDGKKTAIGTIGAMLTALLYNVPPETGVGQVISQVTPILGLSGYAMPVFLAIAAWGALGKLEKWAGASPQPPKTQ